MMDNLQQYEREKEEATAIEAEAAVASTKQGCSTLLTESEMQQWLTI